MIVDYFMRLSGKCHKLTIAKIFLLIAAVNKDMDITRQAQVLLAIDYDMAIYSVYVINKITMEAFIQYPILIKLRKSSCVKITDNALPDNNNNVADQ